MTDAPEKIFDGGDMVLAIQRAQRLLDEPDEPPSPALTEADVAAIYRAIFRLPEPPA